MKTLAEAQTAHVEVDHLRRFVMFFAPRTRDEQITGTYVGQSFAFLLQRNERLTLDQFADRIERHYCMSEPRNAEAVRVMRACAKYPLTADLLGVGDLTPKQSVWLKSCFKAHLSEKGIEAPMPSDLAYASGHHPAEYQEARCEFAQETAGISAPTSKEPPADVIAALQRFAARNGRRWKSALLVLWETGRDDRDPEGPYLRQFRNNFGPAILKQLRLPRATPV